MADVKQILVVDDHFEMLEFLRSMLELSNQDCEVLAVPSAEEGLLELRRSQFDLLITDVRLPGMSGFDLVRRVKALGRDIPVIMITAYSSSQGKKEANELGVYRYFQKPLDTDSVLTAVHTALHGESVILPANTSLTTNLAETAVSDDLQRRLDALRVDTGAVNLTLASAMGEILFSAGDNSQLDLPKLVGIVADNLSNSFLLADELGAAEPFTLQYHMGGEFEFYCANVNRHYFLTLFFDMAARRGRIGTIWVFTQRAIKDLQQLLPAHDALALAAKPAAPSERVEPVVETAVPTPPPPAMPEPEPAPPADYLDIAPDELMDLLATADGPAEETADLDAFWDMSGADDSTESTRGISLEEALQRGLIDFGDAGAVAE
ncbi:MAG: response regulator [Ardenticatenaceae bacterium]|nr:response regulator [Anaerolineales bacterium]MCB8938228.1 response regulator [Ardenticatenaceae bacterium]MCB8975748.1 response regulator [Ardenticatenaceae bacterium]